MANVGIDGKFVPALGIRSSVIADFGQVTSKEICNHLKNFTDQKSSIAITFALDESCTTTDIRKKNEKAKGAKGFKVPFSMLDSTVVEKIKECCGLPVTGDRDKAQESECSTSTEMRTTEAPRTVSEEDVSKLKDIDKALLNHFKDRDQDSSKRGEENEGDDFTETLTPNTKMKWTNYSPHSRKVFKEGVEFAKRLQTLNSQERVEGTESNSSQQELQCTPSLAREDATGTRKRLAFVEGTIGVLTRRATSKPSNEEDVSEETEEKRPCASCNNFSPYKRKKWSREWIQCNQCKEWFHMECSKLRKKPPKKTPWYCFNCQKGTKKD